MISENAVQLGISCVGLSSVLAGSGSADYHVSSSDMITGMGLIIASQVLPILAFLVPAIKMFGLHSSWRASHLSDSCRSYDRATRTLFEPEHVSE